MTKEKNILEKNEKLFIEQLYNNIYFRNLNKKFYFKNGL